MSIELRPYQEESRLAVHREWEHGQRKTLLVLPTGTGKTIVFAKIAEDLVRIGKRVLILAHRGELLEQAADKVEKTTGMGCSVEKAESSCLDDIYMVTVGSVQSLMRPKRLARFRPDYFDAIVVDEAHHALADSYQRVLEHFSNANVLGVTATPDRGDMRKLGEYFGSLAYEYSLPKAIKQGFLCPLRAQTIPLEIDLSGVSVQAGDFKLGDIGNALDPYLHQIADEMKVHCEGRKTVVFLPLIATSQKLCGILNDKGINAVEVNGESRDRTQILRDFDAAPDGALCNSMLLTEGWDCPSVDCIVCLRPTKIRSLYCQIVGRGTRIHPGKDHLLLLDFLWLSGRHELCRPAHIVAANDKVADKMTENMADAGCPVDLEEAEKEAEGDCTHEREEALASQLAAMRKRKGKLVNPLEYALSTENENLASYVPSFGWEAEPPSDTQKKELEKRGIYPDEIESAGMAVQLLDILQERQGSGRTTAKQIRCLERMGFKHVGTWDFDSTQKLVGRIAAAHWRVPRGIDPATYVPKGKT